MGKYPVLFSLVSLVAILLAGCNDPPASSQTGDDNPILHTASGEAFEWASLRGNWVLVNYWAEWCKPCLEEIPELAAVDARDGITVLAVNYDGISGPALESLGRRMGIGFTMLTDSPAQALGWDMPGALPATFVIAPDGSLKQTLLGAQTEAGLLALMKQD